MKLRPIALLVVLVMVLGACASSTPTATVAPQPTATAPAVATTAPTAAPTQAPTSNQPITLNFMYEWDQVNNPQAFAWSQDIVAAFETSHPGITVNATAYTDQEYDTKFQTALGSNTAPDGFMVRPGGWLQTYVNEGVVIPLNDYLSQEGWGDSFLGSALSVCNYGGKIYCLPGGIRSVQIWYNKALFAKYNLTPPTTWDEMTTVANTLKSNGIIPFALGNKEQWEAPLIYEFLLTRSGGYDEYVKAASRDGSAKFSDPVFVQAGQKLADMEKAGWFPQGANGLAFGDMLTQFFSGKAAMAVFLDVMPGIASGSAPKGFQLDYFNFPSLSGTPDTGLVSSIGGAWAISASSKHQAEMAEFLRFWTSQQNMTTLSTEAGWVMSVKDTMNIAAADPLTQRIYNDINSASYMIPFLNYGLETDTSTAAFSGIAQILDGTLDPQTAMNQWEAAAVKEYGK
jgi:raffinose/stachyose/melibiose transport system substrate-binding protein